MKTSLFDFELPESLIATRPAEPRDAARMLVIDEGITDAAISQITRYLHPGDVVVLNNTKVIPARLYGMRGDARIEILLHKKIPSPLEGEGGAQRRVGGISLPFTPPPNLPPQGGEEYWICFARPGKKLRIGDTIRFSEEFLAEVISKLEDGQVLLAFDCPDTALTKKLLQHGHMPLPPYIEKKRAADNTDHDDYQTVFARHEGSVAAPTAGLHFTPKLLEAIQQAGATIAYVTLHVGGGTFLPVKVEDTSEHVMHSEWAQLSSQTAEVINSAKTQGGRVLAVGTTALRTLESAADEAGQLHPFEQETDIFITPGYRFRAVDMLLTNFHLPRSTLFILVCAFAGMEPMQRAYRHAIAQKYRFYSYGDACLLHRSHSQSGVFVL